MVLLYYSIELCGLTALSFPNACHGNPFSCLCSARGIDERSVFSLHQSRNKLTSSTLHTGLCCIFYASLYQKSVENSRTAEHTAEIQTALECR